MLMCMHLLPFSLHMYTKYQQYYFVLHDHGQFIGMYFFKSSMSAFLRYCVQHDKVLEAWLRWWRNEGRTATLKRWQIHTQKSGLRTLRWSSISYLNNWELQCVQCLLHTAQGKEFASPSRKPQDAVIWRRNLQLLVFVHTGQSFVNTSTRGRLCWFPMDLRPESLTWLWLCQRCTLTQDPICSLPWLPAPRSLVVCRLKSFSINLHFLSESMVRYIDTVYTFRFLFLPPPLTWRFSDCFQV